jgi:hypothetical protein
VISYGPLWNPHRGRDLAHGVRVVLHGQGEGLIGRKRQHHVLQPEGGRVPSGRIAERGVSEFVQIQQCVFVFVPAVVLSCRLRQQTDGLEHPDPETLPLARVPDVERQHLLSRFGDIPETGMPPLGAAAGAEDEELDACLLHDGLRVFCIQDDSPRCLDQGAVAALEGEPEPEPERLQFGRRSERFRRCVIARSFHGAPE